MSKKVQKVAQMFCTEKIIMWLSGLFSGRKVTQYPNATTALHNKESGDLKKGEMTGSKTSGAKTTLHNKGSGDLKKEKMTSTKTSGGDFTSDFTVIDPSAYDFLWTIKSFSKLLSDNESKQTSGIFEAKGCSWKLILYPNGYSVNEQISLYLMLSAATSHPTEAAFKVSFELFLFNQKNGSTSSEKGERFMQVRNICGFSYFIDHKIFKDSSNGYLYKGSCMLGVKILQVVPIQTKIECLRPVEKISHEYTWKIEKFSKIKKKKTHERNFTAGDYLWSIIIHPKGNQKSDNKLSLFLSYKGSIYEGLSTKVSAKFSLTIIDQIGGNHKKNTSTHVFKCTDHGWGSDFIPLEHFNDPALGFLVKDTCIIEVKVVVLGLVK